MFVAKFVARIAALAAAALCAASAADAKTLRWASQGDALTLDPHSQNEGPTTAMNNHVYEALISRDPSLAKVPGLALSWKTIAPDVWEFKLRPDVKFSDGTPFTAEDVVFSYNRALAPTLRLPLLHLLDQGGEGDRSAHRAHHHRRAQPHPARLHQRRS